MAKAGKVLIIEDRRENIVFIANNILKPEGWEIITARDGKLGLQKAIDEKPDLIITDLKLPKMHGLDVLEELNKRGHHIPAIVMTFHGSEETAIRAFRLGAVDYLIKPFDIEDMMAAIDRALQSGPARAAAPPAGAESDLSKRLTSQEQEIQRLKSLLQQKEKALQELQRPGQAPAGSAGSDVARWQAVLKEKETALANLQKQMAAQSRAMSQEINHLKAQLTEKEAIVMDLQSQAFQAASAAGAQSEPGDLPAQLADKEGALTKADKLVKALTRTVAAQQKTIEKHRQEAERLARELHALAAGIQMLGQSLGDQASQMASSLPKEE
jgi:DNA-binding response OmpR family regulator